MPLAKSNSDLTPESVHDAWVHQRADLERDLFENWTIEVRPSVPVAQMPARQSSADELAQHRTAFEQELSSRQPSESMIQDQQPAAAPSATDAPAIPEAVSKRVPELSSSRAHEEMLQWRRQVEAELAEARRIFEQERQTQQQEFAQQRETEMSRLRREREEFEARVRQTQLELAHVRRRQDDDWRQIRDVQLAQIRAERAELEQLRDTWLEKLRREQAVLQHGVQFFGQHLSRVSDELREAQRGLEATPTFACEPIPEATNSEPCPSAEHLLPFEPVILSLDEIRQRLNELKPPQRSAA